MASRPTSLPLSVLMNVVNDAEGYAKFGDATSDFLVNKHARPRHRRQGVPTPRSGDRSSTATLG